MLVCSTHYFSCRKSKRSSKVIPITNVRGEPPRAVRPQKIEMVQYTRHGAELTEVSA